MARTLKVDLIKEIKDNLKSSMGGCGSTLITGTTQVTGNWYAVVTSGITDEASVVGAESISTGILPPNCVPNSLPNSLRPSPKPNNSAEV